MELSEFIKVKGENYHGTGEQLVDSSNALGFVEIANENISNIFVQNFLNNKPIDWHEVKKNLGGMMTGIANFCQVNSIDLRQVLDENVRKLNEKKENNEELLILHKEDIIFSNKPFDNGT